MVVCVEWSALSPCPKAAACSGDRRLARPSSSSAAYPDTSLCHLSLATRSSASMRGASRSCSSFSFFLAMEAVDDVVSSQSLSELKNTPLEPPTLPPTPPPPPTLSTSIIPEEEEEEEEGGGGGGGEHSDGSERRHSCSWAISETHRSWSTQAARQAAVTRRHSTRTAFMGAY